MTTKEMIFTGAITLTTALGTLAFNTLSDSTKENKQEIKEIDKRQDSTDIKYAEMHKDIEYNQKLLIELVEIAKNNK